VSENLLARWRMHLPPQADAIRWAAERCRIDGHADIADGYDHAVQVFYDGAAAAWTPMRVAVATLLLSHPPMRFVSAPAGAMIVDFWLGAVDLEAALRGLWATRSLVTKIVYEGDASLTLLVPGKTRVGDSPPLRDDVWHALRVGLETGAPAFVPADLWDAGDDDDRALLAYLCPWQPGWALEQARALLAQPPEPATRYKWGRRALRVVASLADPAEVGTLVGALIAHRAVPEMSTPKRPWAEALCRRGDDFVRALLPAADVDIVVLGALVAHGGPVVVDYLTHRAVEPLRRVQASVTALLLQHRELALASAARRPDAVGRRLRAVLAAPPTPALPPWAAPASFSAFDLDPEQLGVVVGKLLAVGARRAELAKVTRAAPPAFHEQLPALALELFERWRLFGGEPAHEQIVKTLGLLPSDAAADRLGELVFAIGRVSDAGNLSVLGEEERHRLTYLDVLLAMNTDRAVGWLRACATERERPAEVRRIAKRLVERAAKARKTDVASLPRLDGARTAFARLAPPVRRALEHALNDAVRETAYELVDLQKRYEDDTYEVRKTEIDRMWAVLEASLGALLPEAFAKAKRTAVLAELHERFELACMEASPKWAG
jgi:hypothetical protein